MIDKDKIQELTYQFLLAIGEDPKREGLLDTPKRVANMCSELLEPERAMAKNTVFEANNYDGVVMIRDIQFSSICEHHLLPFIGCVHIAYIPDQKVIGISKLARMVDKHAKKLQIQERLASEIANDLSCAVKAKGVAVYIEAKHICMNIRGVLRRDASTVTTVFLGEFKEFKMQEMFMDLVSRSNR
jgi:GTP cyclohydrolase I